MSTLLVTHSLSELVHLEYKLKNQILLASLLLSVVLNVAGTVVCVLYITERAHAKTMRLERAALEANLGMASNGKRIVQTLKSDVIAKCTFASHTDGELDYYAFQPPQCLNKSRDYTLVVYLHGMGFNYMEPFIAPAGQTQALADTLTHDNPQLAILSCSYRKEASWGNDAAMSDIIQNMHEVMQAYPFKSIVLMGTSMGGCVALNLAATAPDDIKAKLAGVVSMEAAGDLEAIWDRTKDKLIRPALVLALGGAPAQVPLAWKKASFFHNIAGLPPTTKIYLLSSRQDTVIPADLQKVIVTVLNEHAIANRLVEVNGEHKVPAAEYYANGYNYVVGQSQLQNQPTLSKAAQKQGSVPAH